MEMLEKMRAIVKGNDLCVLATVSVGSPIVLSCPILQMKRAMRSIWFLTEGQGNI
jgi:hypothetical protein